jgi:hypothetical protein
MPLEAEAEAPAGESMAWGVGVADTAAAAVTAAASSLAAGFMSPSGDATSRRGRRCATPAAAVAAAVSGAGVTTADGATCGRALAAWSLGTDNTGLAILAPPPGASASRGEPPVAEDEDAASSCPSVKAVRAETSRLPLPADS